MCGIVRLKGIEKEKRREWKATKKIKIERRKEHENEKAKREMGEDEEERAVHGVTVPAC